jgi:hypothetical protein
MEESYQDHYDAKSLLLQIAAGDETAFALMVDRHWLKD